ncbi:MAG: hypothetical protein MUF83_22445 [Acidimicrobiales bacterium]|jgi:hypothetical protein|nr:hypothetical protein [Acidimicrobiales bacterium]
MLITACGSTGDAESAGTATVPVQPAESEPAALGEIDPADRVSDGAPEPRSAQYWITWSTCGAGSKSDLATANGGREAGWVLLDDLLATPGVALAGRRMTTCDDAVMVLTGAEGTDVTARLAAESLAAEVNYASGAETCRAFDGALRVGRALLEWWEVGGAGSRPADDAEVDALARETIDLLATYNQGNLCR